MEFGGMGGVRGGRKLDMHDLFEVAVNETLGESIKNDQIVACEMWTALANRTWKCTNGDTASYTFRSAGDLVAAVRGHGNYMDWYCCNKDNDYGYVAPRIAEALAARGWTPE